MWSGLDSDADDDVESVERLFNSSGCRMVAFWSRDPAAVVAPFPVSETRRKSRRRRDAISSRNLATVITGYVPPELLR